MMLQLDIGNSRIKWRLKMDGVESGRGTIASTALQELPAALPEAADIDALWVSSVAGAERERELAGMAGERWACEPWFARTGAVACGLRNSYQEPARMGVDRWLAMLAAWCAGSGNVCVVDAGSALTIDFVDRGGQHLGGYILPGLLSMERALLSDTDRVRFGDAARDRLDPGRSTEEAVYNGLLLSQAGAVALALERMGGDYAVIYSGGDGEVLRDLLTPAGEYRQDLVLDGLEMLGREQLGAERP